MYIVHYVDDDILQARLAFSMRKYSIEPSNDLLSEGRGEPCATSHRDLGGAGLVPGPAGDHSDSPQRLRHGLQQGRLPIYSTNVLPTWKRNQTEEKTKVVAAVWGQN